jgi:hypothetical protein
MKKLLTIIFIFSFVFMYGQRENCIRIKMPPKAKLLNEFITTEHSKIPGLFNVYNKENRWFFEIPDSLLDREIMSVTRFTRMPPGAPFYSGELSNQQMIRFEESKNGRINLRSVGAVVTCPDSTASIFTAVENSNYQPIIKSFDIIAFSDDSYLIDVTQIFASDLPFLMKPPMKILFGIISIDQENSYITSVRSYPQNTEVSVVKNFSVKSDSKIQLARESGYMTMEFNTSLLLLPKVPMESRKYDRRLGYFSNSSEIYSDNLQDVPKYEVINRHRLESKSDLDAILQSHGELIEPKKPIVFYIDPATPEKWRPYLKSGVEDWNVAFEYAGWKNAVRCIIPEEADSVNILEDARFSVIRYLASSNPNAYSINVIDPRSGEIVQTQIGWYHNVMQLLHDWYFTQTAASDPKARLAEYSDELMGELIRFVSSHEVGHSLGLIHNMRASSSTPVEKLRDPGWIEKYGHTASIMDYCRFNYVAQPEDSIRNYFPRINDYDKWAIKWGYAPLYGKSEEEQEKILDKWVDEAFKNPRLRYTHEALDGVDPRNQTEDLGDNSMKASEYGIKNLKRIISGLREWSTYSQRDYKLMERRYNSVTAQFGRYMGHVLSNIGGLYCEPNTPAMSGASFTAVPAHIQRDAVKFLCDNLFATPYWLVDNTILCDIYKLSSTDVLLRLQSKVIAGLFDTKRLGRIISYSRETGFSVNELIGTLTESIFKELKSSDNIDQYRRNLQRLYIVSLLELVKKDEESISLESMSYGSYGNDLKFSDLIPAAKSSLRTLTGKLERRTRKGDDEITSAHCRELALKIKGAIK